MSETRRGRSLSLRVTRVEGAQRVARKDVVAAEEPLEIRVRRGGGPTLSLAVTMRTPGHDFELAAGFLFSEGLIGRPRDVVRLSYCSDPQNFNVVVATLSEALELDPARFSRNVYTTSSCGICGKASLDLVEQALPFGPAPAPSLDTDWLLGLPDRMRQAQALFEQTGGLHAAALFAAGGELLLLREDVGRHNALDKVLGHQFLAGALPARAQVLLLSGRISFELVQKAAMAGLTTVAALGAPSSLAVDLARRTQVTLIGFLGKSGFNLYTGAERLL